MLPSLFPPFKPLSASDAGTPAACPDYDQCSPGYLRRLSAAQRARDPHYRELGRLIASAIIHDDLPDVVDRLARQFGSPRRDVRIPLLKLVATEKE
jgi:hypothetical protein